MKMKEYKVNIKVGDKVVFKAVVWAFDTKQAMEFAYEQFESQSYAEVVR